MNLLHVIPPGQQLIVTPDLGVEGVIEDDEETKRAVVSTFRIELKSKEVPVAEQKVV